MAIHLSAALRRPWALGLLSAAVLLSGGARADDLPAKVEFNRDIRPILTDACFHCHGPDEAKRKADLRLDTLAGIRADLGGYHAIEPGRPDKSEVVARIEATDADDRMPPEKAGRTLSPREIKLVRRWIEQGAAWQPHWAFAPPVKPALPPLPPKDASWVKNPIDAFVLDRLLRDGLRPSPPASKPTLLRRLTLDLTGLPPTPAEVRAFVADASPRAFDNVVDRLLASPRYGEHMASRWMYAARYADTDGYQNDRERQMWRWRDWVIDAFNANMRFDRFTIEQLAGDLMPDATPSQRIATGFHRNHRGNTEGGIIPEEFLVEYVVDRVDTTATVWLGLTLACARCHDHKYDPFTQKEFYRLYALWNNVPELGRVGGVMNSPPVVRSPTPEQALRLARLEATLAAAEAHVRGLDTATAAAQARWEAASASAAAALGDFVPSDAIELRPGGAASDDIGDFDGEDRFTLDARIETAAPSAAILSRMENDGEKLGWALTLRDGRVHFALTNRWLDDGLRVRARDRLRPGRPHHVLVSYDGSRFAAGITLLVDGAPVAVDVELDSFVNATRNKEAVRVGAAPDVPAFDMGSGKLWDVRMWPRALSRREAEIAAVADPVTAILRRPPAFRSPSQAAKLRGFFIAQIAPTEIRDAHAAARDARRARDTFADRIPTTMVMAESPRRRDTFVLFRGEYDKPRDKVTAGLPAALTGGQTDAVPVRDRLELARWLVDAQNPLTARVTVNRLWQALFGVGIVKTAENFGSQGEWPTHPELLDWLATAFTGNGWDVKALIKTIVQSATYQQQSNASADLVERDPENRLLARGPRFRLSAEVLRDQALALAGLLIEQRGGPSVKVYQPAGLWEEYSGAKFARDRGDALYRRSLYTYWKRTIAPPVLATFDAPSRETCQVRESRTNTPLQALALLNDVTYVEAARRLGARIVREGGRTVSARLRFAFELVLARTPTTTELAIAQRHLHRAHADYRRRQTDAEALTNFGDAQPDAKLPVVEAAAYTSLAQLLLNLDETVTKE